MRFGCGPPVYTQQQLSSQNYISHAFKFIGMYSQLLRVVSDTLTALHMSTTYQQWVWEREAHINWSMVKPEKAALVTGSILRTTGPVPADSPH